MHGQTHAQTDAWTPAWVPSYKLTWWAFSSGELKSNCCPLHWSYFHQNKNLKIKSQRINEPPHDKTNKMACAPSKDSDQPGHLPRRNWKILTKTKHRQYQCKHSSNWAIKTHCRPVRYTLNWQKKYKYRFKIFHFGQKYNHCQNRAEMKPRHEKTCLYHIQTTKAQISLRIRTVWPAPLLFAA